MQPFDIAKTPLKGMYFIEASAGTGKTHTIAELYLRLVMEEGLPVKQILVVTYTNAATKELRDRIYARLSVQQSALLSGKVSHQNAQPDTEKALRHLNNALRGFDDASIFTIHGFCKRVLKEHAFDSGLSFETELLTNTSALLQEIADDFWRRTFYTASPSLVTYLVEKKLSPGKLLASVGKYLGKEYLAIQTSTSVDTAVLEEAFCRAYQQGRAMWMEKSKEIQELLESSPALNRNSYRKMSIPVWCAAMDAHFSSEESPLSFPKGFEHFTTEKIVRSTKNGNISPLHPFFDICQALVNILPPLLKYYQNTIGLQLLEYCNKELSHRKRQQHKQSYDDLLTNLQKALADTHSRNILVDKLRQRYSAALIDEFQDTDPVQYDIFRTLYSDTEKPVFLVGDPKQAIYSFRGADIFTYMGAKKGNVSAQTHTLLKNWRSDPLLLTGVNAIFNASAGAPFVFEDIAFHHVDPAEQDKNETLWIKEGSPAPLQIWLLPPADGNHSKKTLAKEKAADHSIVATTHEIARLLDLGARGEALIGARPLSGRDIAVLVRTNKQGHQVRNALLQLGIPSVQQAHQSVFFSREAVYFEQLLTAFLEPNYEGNLYAVLASEWMGLDAQALFDLRNDDRRWADWLETFQIYRRLWKKHGFIRCFRTWLVEQDVAARLLAFDDGERKLTNLLHLAELLHYQSCRNPHMAGLLRYLAACRSEVSEEKDEGQQLRLESDDDLVHIVTVHKSKGLEYGISFCPFVWEGKDVADPKIEAGGPLLYHDASNENTPTLAFGVHDDDIIASMRREKMAESIRLFYVALTRAKYRCYFTWGNINQAWAAPPAWLLHWRHDTDFDQAKDVFEKASIAELQEELQCRLQSAGRAIEITPITLGIGPATQCPAKVLERPLYDARPFQGSLAPAWRVTSFTALTSYTAHAEPVVQIHDHDKVERVYLLPETIPTQSSHVRMAFPHGARAGQCLHAILEVIDFTTEETDPPRHQWVAQILTQHGFSAEEWADPVCGWIRDVLKTPLLPMRQGLSLCVLGQEQRASEWEFTYPLPFLSTEKLHSVLKKHGIVGDAHWIMADRLSFQPVHGYMKGVVDMIFTWEGQWYLVDYKSNLLGDEINAYHKDALKEDMVQEAYFLQLLIYTVALHRYLQSRIPDYIYESHFGGVFYLFLRGMHPSTGPDTGVFFTKPPADLIHALDRLFATGAEMSS